MAEVSQPKLSKAELAASYGYAMALLNSDGELAALFKKAVSKQYTPERFQAELRATNWFQSKSESQRRYAVLRTTEPAQYVSQMQQTMASLADQYSQMTGEILSVNYPRLEGKTIVNGSGFLAHAADMALQLGWNEAQIRDHLFKSVDWKTRIHNFTLSGQASGYVQGFRQQAAAYGVQPSEDWYGQKLGAVVLGNDSTEGVLGQIKKMAMDRYSHFADQIAAGETVADIAENYMQSMGRILEINPQSLDVFDKQIQEGLKARPVEGGKPGQRAAMTISDFEDRLRTDDRWQYTDNAKETVLGQGKAVLEKMGLLA